MRLLDSIIARYTANKLLRAPNSGGIAGDEPLPRPDLFDDAFRFIGYHEDSLACWVVEPKLLGVKFSNEYLVGKDAEQVIDQYPAPRAAHGDAPLAVIKRGDGEPVEPRNRTLILLHGWWDSVLRRPYQRVLAAKLASEGYRVVMPDLRGHGLSQGRFLSYGLLDRYDIRCLIDELDRRGWAKDGVGVFGHSYGGNVALLSAEQDERIQSVVAASAPGSLRGVLPASAKHFTPHLAWLASNRALDKGVQIASKRAGLDFYQSSAEDAIARVDTPVLLVHGERDVTVPFENAERIYRSRPEGTETLFWPDELHASYFTSRLDEFADRVLNFFGTTWKP